MSDFKISQLGPLDNYNEEDINTRLKKLTEMLVQLQADKGANYGNSWQHYGEAVSIFANIARKFNRLEQLVLYGAQGTSDEAKLDTVADLAVYALLWTVYLSKKDPVAFTAWKERNGLE